MTQLGHESSAMLKAVEAIRAAKRMVAFTGAGISVESGIPPFRGPGGLWEKYDPETLDIDHFLANPERAWVKIKEIFYDFFGNAEPNLAHRALAQLEKEGKLGCVITQNIDNLHQLSGSSYVIEFHGNSSRLICLKCGKIVPATREILDKLPPRCNSCERILKPNFVFYGEAIPDGIHDQALAEVELADICLVIGTTGEVYPAATIPYAASDAGKLVIEVNVSPSSFTYSITDIFLQGKAGTIMQEMVDRLYPSPSGR